MELICIDIIIVNNFEEWEEFEPCLESVIEHKHASSQITVVDNSDQKRVSSRIQTAYPQVKTINCANNGFGAGNNIAALHSKADFLVFLNPDTIVSPQWDISLVEFLQKNPEAGLVTSKILVKGDPAKINAFGNMIHITGITQCNDLFEPSHNDHREIEQVLAISGASFAIRRELFQELNGFNEGYFLYLEDTDLSIRALLLGWKIYAIPDSIVYHDYHVAFRKNKIYHLERNRLILMLSTFKRVTLILLIPAMILMEIITWGFILINFPRLYREKIDAYLWINKNRDVILKNKKENQRTRTINDRDLIKKMGVSLDFTKYSNILVAIISHLVFTPLFFVLKLVLLLVVWW